MKRKKMENSMRLEQMLMDLDIIDHDFFLHSYSHLHRIFMNQFIRSAYIIHRANEIATVLSLKFQEFS